MFEDYWNETDLLVKSDGGVTKVARLFSGAGAYLENASGWFPRIFNHSTKKVL